MNKTNSRSKLLVAVLAMFLVAVGATVVFSDNVNAEDPTNVATIGSTTYTDIDRAIEAAQNATADADKIINLINNVTIDSSLTLTGITINCGSHDITFSSASDAIIITGGTINGTGLGTSENKNGGYGDQIVSISGNSKVTFNGTEFNSEYTEITDGNTYQKGNYAYYIIVSTASDVEFNDCAFNSTQPKNSDYSDWGAIYDGSNKMVLIGCTIEGQGKVNYASSSGILEFDNTQAYLQLVGTNISVDLADVITKNNGAILGTFFGWGFNDSSYTPANTENAAPEGQEDTKVTFTDSREQKTPVDLGQFYKGNDSNSVANGKTEVNTTPEVEYEPDVSGITVTQDNKTVISGTIANSTTYASNTIFKDVTVNPGVVITIGGDVEVQGYFNLYGTIDSGATPAKVNVTNGAKLTAYAGAYLGNNVTILGSGDIDLSAALYTGEWYQDIVSDITLSQIQRVVINDTITIYSGRTFTILGELVINEGATIIIQPGATLKIGSTNDTITATGMTVNGTVEIEGNQTTYGTLKVEKAQEVNIAGSVLSEGLIDISSKVTIKNGGVVEVMEADNSKLVVDNGLIVDVGGQLIISSNFYTPGIDNKGTVILDHAKLDFSDSSINSNRVNINLVGDGAIVEIDSVTTTEEGTLRVQDNGLAFETDRNGNPVSGEQIALTGGQSNAVHINLLADGGVRGLTITESVTSVRENGDMKYSNSMIISGTVNSESDDVSDVNIDLRGMGRTDANAGGLYINAEDSVTLGKNVQMDLVNGKLTVNGNLTAIADGSAVTTSSGTDVYVAGMITVQNISKTYTDNGDSEETFSIETGMNAFHYEGTTDETADYNYYTTLPVALENSTDIRFIGEVTVLENATITDGTRLSAASDLTSVMNIGDEDNRDVVVTVQNGGSIRNGTVNVYATLTFENNSRDNRVGNDGSKVYSDVIINNDPARTYTNIYTAISGAQDETIKLSGKWPVVLNQNITIPAGVILEVPAGSTLTIYNGVTMTVDGTVRNSGTINNDMPKVGNEYPEGDEPAGFNPMSGDEPNTDAVTIVINGLFMSLNEIPYANDGSTQGYYIPGAYYQIIDSNGAWYYVTPIEQAAAVSDSVNLGEITIRGDVETSDLTFTGDEEQPVVVSVVGELTAGTIILTYASVDVTITGAYTGSIVNNAGSIDLVNVRNVTVQGTVDDDEAATVLLTVSGTPASADEDMDSSVTVATGTVNAGAQLTINTEVTIGVTSVVDEFNVASGAQLTVGSGSQFTADEISVDGTLYAVNGGKVIVKTLTVRGTFTVAATDNDNGISAGVADITDVYIGIAKNDRGQFVDASAAVVNADSLGNKLKTAYVSAESTFDGKLTQTMNSTEFYVEDALWMTVYTNDTLSIVDRTGNGTTDDPYEYDYNFQPGDLTQSAFVAWMNSEGKNITSGNIGSTGCEQVYASIMYDVYAVIVMTDNSIGSVAIDGQMLLQTSYGYVLPGDNNNIGGLLDAGQHTITYTLAAGYEGTPTLSSNGTNVVVSGMDFTLSGDFLDANGVLNINYLVLGGAEYVGNTVVVDGGNQGGDTGMGLTDYLLIILVILIVIMAIMVAFRLMRS